MTVDSRGGSRQDGLSSPSRSGDGDSSNSFTKGEVSITDVVMICITANLGPFLFGFDQGSTSWIISAFDSAGDSYEGSPNYYLEVSENDFMVGLISSLSSISGTFMFVYLLFHAQHWSKKSELVACSMMYTLGYSLATIAASIKWTSAENYSVSLSMLLLSRVQIGISNAMAMHSVPQYLSEVSPQSIRGQVGSSIELGVVSGISVGMVLGYLLSLVDMQSYMPLMALSTAVAVLMAAMVVTLPDSPRHMFSHGWWSLSGVRRYTDHDILQSVQRLYPKASVETVQEMRLQFLQDSRETERWKKLYALEHASDDNVTVMMDEGDGVNGENSGSGSGSGTGNERSASHRIPNPWALEDRPGNSPYFICPAEPFPVSVELKVLFTDPAISQCLVLALTVMFFKSMTGKGAFGYNAYTIYEAMLPDYGGLCVAGNGIVMLLGSVSMVFIGDKIDRRTFFIVGGAGCAMFQLLASFFLVMGWPVASVIAMYCFYIVFEMSFGSLGWVIVSEYFPFFVRSAAVGVALIVLFGVSAILILCYGAFQQAVGVSLTFMTFALITLVGMIVLYVIIPDTRGVHMEKAYRLVAARFNNLREYMGWDARKVGEARSLFDADEVDAMGETDRLVESQREED